MKICKKIEIETLNLKFKTEQLEIVESQYQEGANDLHFRLSHFRKRVASKDIQRYDKHFFGEIDQDKKVTCSKKEPPVLHKRKPYWIKSIYRKIVSSTHPDKFQNFSVQTLKEKYITIYRKTIEAWEKGEDDIILIAAYESDVLVDNPDALLILEKGNKQKTKKIEEIKNFLAYQWYHVPESDRSKTLEKYLEQLGYEFSSEEVEKIVNLPRKRRVGTRPKSLKSLKNVK